MGQTFHITVTRTVTETIEILEADCLEEAIERVSNDGGIVIARQSDKRIEIVDIEDDFEPIDNPAKIASEIASK